MIYEGLCIGLMGALIIMAGYSLRLYGQAGRLEADIEDEKRGRALEKGAREFWQAERDKSTRDWNDAKKRQTELLAINADLHAQLRALHSATIFSDLHLLDGFAPKWGRIELDPLWTEEIQPWLRRILYQTMRMASTEKDPDEARGLLRDVRLLEAIVRQPGIEVRDDMIRERARADHREALDMTEA